MVNRPDASLRTEVNPHRNLERVFYCVADEQPVPRIRTTDIEQVYTDGSGIFTRNLVPGEDVYGESLRVQEGVEYRFWNPRKSKLAALVHNGCELFPFDSETEVLYLGAAGGTTASHLSDICTEGMVYCVEVSPRPFRKLVAVSERRRNMLPILGDANRPEDYRTIVGRAHVIYQDVAQRNQAGILLKNLELLREDGLVFLMVKARSIDVTKRPSRIYDLVAGDLSSSGMSIVQVVDLAPFEKDHAAIVARKIR